MYIDEQVQGTIYFVDGTSFQFDTNDIIDDDISILQQATADDSFSVGSTYSDTINMTIRISKITNSYDIIGLRIVLKSKYGSEAKYVLCGVFWVTFASKYKDIYTITGSDAITWLDTIPYLDQTYVDNNGKEYNNLVYAYMFRDINGLNAKLQGIADAVNWYLSNNNVNISRISSYSNTILNDRPPASGGYRETFYCVLPKEDVGENANPCPRDYAGWLSQIACGFLKCTYLENDETPYISIGQFETSPTETLKWQNFEESTLEIASFTINCCQVYVEIYNGTLGSTTITNKNMNSFTIDLTGNAFVDGHWEYRENSEGDHNAMDILNNIANFIVNVPIRPFSGTYHGEKRFYLGQCVTLVDENGKTCNTILTKIQWNFRGGYELKCAGKDNRILFDSVRRTPSIKAKEQALTKTNYAIKKTESEVKQVIADVNDQLKNEIGSVGGDTQTIGAYVNDLWFDMYEDGIIKDLKTRIGKLEGLHGITS